MAMKTTLDLPDELMRALKLRAAATDRRLKDVVAETIAAGLAANDPEYGRRHLPKVARAGSGKGSRKPSRIGIDPALEALFAAGDAMAATGVDFAEWARHSRDVWR